MKSSQRQSASGEREIQTLGFERPGSLRSLEFLRFLRDEPLDLFFGAVRLLADARPFGSGNAPEGTEEPGQLTGAAQEADANRFEVTRGAGLGDLREGPVEDRLDPRVLGHVQARWARAVSASFAKAVGSETASSARTFRSIPIPAFLSPFMNTEYESPT